MFPKLSADGKALPFVVSTNLMQLVGSEVVDGILPVGPFGLNSDIDTSTVPAYVCPGGSNFQWIPSARALEIVSDNVADTNLGNGARQVLIRALDSDWNEVTIAATMNGTTPVALSPNILRINEFAILRAGSAQANVGTLSIRDVGTPANVRATVFPGDGYLRQAIWSVPAGHRMLIYSYFASINRQNSDRWATVEFWARNNRTADGINNFGMIFIASESGISSNSPASYSTTIPFIIGEKHDVAMRVTDVSGNDTSVTANFRAIQERL